MKRFASAKLRQQSNPSKQLISHKELNMKCNIGHTDRVLRMTVGVTLMGLAGFGITGPWAWIGILPLLTGMLGYCGAYSLLGINTAKK
jgi:hypothetical protein